MNRSVYSLQPDVAEKALAFFAELTEKGILFFTLETLRTKEIQEAYYAQGRRRLGDVNLLRRKAGLWDIGEAENSRKITWTMNSRHLSGRALDIAPRTEDYKILWGAPFEEWEKIGVIGESHGFEWGGRWEELDLPHFEMA